MGKNKFEMSLKTILSQQKELSASPFVSVMTAALFTRPMNEVARNPNIRLLNFFSHTLTHTIEPFDQEGTGTCWLQAGMALLSLYGLQRNIKFEPSIMYLMFYDKLDKAAVFLKRFATETIDDRTRVHLLQEPISDGGTWSMFVYLVLKYGIVPKSAYPETYQSRNTFYMNAVLNTYLRTNASSVTMDTFHDHMEKVHTILLSCMSTPPSNVELFRDMHSMDFTGSPQDLFSKFNVDVMQFQCFMHAPNKLTPSSFTVYSTNSTSDMRQHTFHTTTTAELKRTCVAMIKNNHPVWFTANVNGGADFDRGLMEVDAVDYDMLFHISSSEKYDKAMLMEARVVSPNHAMLIVGVHCDVSGMPVRWKVQNSWGDKNGYLVMSNEWFDHNVFELAIFKPYVTCKIVNADSPTMLDPWDVLSTVA